MIDLKYLSPKARELLEKAHTLHTPNEKLWENDEYMDIYKEFLLETNFKYKNEGLNGFDVASVRNHRITKITKS